MWTSFRLVLELPYNVRVVRREVFPSEESAVEFIKDNGLPVELSIVPESEIDNSYIVVPFTGRERAE